MALITVSQGKREGAFGGPDGAYQATLVAIEGPRPATNSRTGEEFSLLDWVFAIEGAPDDACLVWASTSVASGPKSKMYGYLTALLGGRAPAVGQSFEAADLVGRQALVTIRRDEDGWLKVENVSAMPAAVPPQPTPAVVTPPAAPQVNGAHTLRQRLAQAQPKQDLPF
ncbi:MAG TPA: hypothetical protein VM305_02060 [Candidatus Limnocylindrales bacterium]|nr:hypothetical protein [Candidatus Limnocylindrales bacterium]